MTTPFSPETTSAAPVSSLRRDHRDRRDLTARARIRDAALLCFARGGFRVPLRVIAAEAGVSIPLITHHYGTKDALHAVCDDWVLQRFVDLKLMVIDHPHALRSALDDTADQSVLTVYMVRSFLDTTDGAGRFFARFLDHLRTVNDKALAAGLVVPAADEEERLRLLATSTIGMLLVEFVTNPPVDPRDFIDQVYNRRNMAALLDFYTHPYLAESAALDSYRETISGS